MSALEQEKELHSILRFFEIFGLQYFSLRELNYKNAKERPSKLRLAYLVFVFFVIGMCWLTVDVILDYTSDKKSREVTDKNMMSFTLNIVTQILIAANFLTIFIKAFMSTAEMKKFYINSREISQLFREMNRDTLKLKKVKNNVLPILCLYVSYIIVNYLKMSIYHPENAISIILTGWLNFILLLGTFKFFFHGGNDKSATQAVG